MKKLEHSRLPCGIIIFVLLLVVQIFLGKVGHFFADMIPYQQIDPFVFNVDYFQIFYAFVLGSIQGIVYQRSKSILYPMLMHSFSNVLMVGMGYLFVTESLVI